MILTLLSFIDQLTICNNSIWLHYYRLMIYSCYEEIRNHLNINERNESWIKVKDKYKQLMNLKYWIQPNHPDRMWILSDFTHLCYWYYSSIENESIELVNKWINEVKTIEKSMISEVELNKSKIRIERCENNFEMCQLRFEWSQMGINARQIYCNEQMKKLQIITNIKLNTKDMANIWEAFAIQLNLYSNNIKEQYLYEILQQLDQIGIINDINWIYYYRLIIYNCYLKFAEISINNRHKLANRMILKYRQLIEISNQIFINELNNPNRIDIINHFSILCYNRYRNQIDTECIQYIQLIIAKAKLLSKGSLTDFEFEQSQRLIERIQNRSSNLISAPFLINVHRSKSIS